MIPELLADAAITLTAVVGLFVTVLATEGYRRQDSRAMAALAVGVFAISVVPFVVGELLAPLVALTDAQALLVIYLSHTVGLLAIYRTFRN
jgi:hypothetical protein